MQGLKQFISIYGDDISLAGYNYHKAKANFDEAAAKKKRKPAIGKPDKTNLNGGFTALSELTKKASEKLLEAAEKAYQLSRYVRRGARYGMMTTPVVHEDEMDDLHARLKRFNQEAKKNPELLKKLKVQ